MAKGFYSFPRLLSSYAQGTCTVERVITSPNHALVTALLKLIGHEQRHTQKPPTSPRRMASDEEMPSKT